MDSFHRHLDELERLLSDDDKKKGRMKSRALSFAAFVGSKRFTLAGGDCQQSIDCWQYLWLKKSYKYWTEISRERTSNCSVLYSLHGFQLGLFCKISWGTCWIHWVVIKYRCTFILYRKYNPTTTASAVHTGTKWNPPANSESCSWKHSPTLSKWHVPKPCTILQRHRTGQSLWILLGSKAR